MEERRERDRRSRLVWLLLMVISIMNSTSCTQGKPRTIEIVVQVPDTGWAVEIRSIYRVDGELWVIAQLDRSEGMAAQMITEVEDEVTVELPPDLPLRYFVLGKTWGWENQEPYDFIESLDEIDEELEEGELVFQRQE